MSHNFKYKYDKIEWLKLINLIKINQFKQDASIINNEEETDSKTDFVSY